MYPYEADGESVTESQQLIDPFVEDEHERAASTSTPRQQEPVQVNAVNASLLLASQEQSAVDENQERAQQQPTAHAQAVRMGKMRAVDESMDSASDGGEGDEESRPRLDSSDHNTQQATASKPSKRKPKRNHTSASVATLATIGRQILRAGKDTQRQDAEARGSASNPIHLATDAGKTAPSTTHLNKREQALWMWANVDNIDDFLKEVYGYYMGKGFQCVALTRGCNLLTIGFVIIFSTFLTGCVDYNAIKHGGRLSDVIIPQCTTRFSFLGSLTLLAFVLIYGLLLTRFAFGLKRLNIMRLFYQELLEIPEADIQTIPWHNVIDRLAKVAQLHPHPSNHPIPPLDVHQVANRLMRQDNYLIALFNRDLLDLKVPVGAASTTFLTRSLQWNLNFCLLGYLFDQNGNVRKQFLNERYRMDLIHGLQRRFIFMAIINAIFAPFIVLYLLVYSFFRYFEEYHKNPSTLGSRQYTELARWKFREFNELPHLFRRRCHASYPYASRYIEQFPKERNAIIARFVAFVAGSFTAVLLLASVLDPDLFVHFEIAFQQNVLFYIGIFGAVLAVARGMIPDERLVFEPEALLEAVTHYTHYCPDHWKARFHSAEVHAEFGALYSLKVSIFFVEVLSVLVTPFILWLSLPKNAPAIIDFFRECTVHVEGLGYVCSFAVFDFARNGREEQTRKSDAQPNPGDDGTPSAPPPRRQPPHSTNSKLEHSVINFALANDWQPEDIASSVYLEKIQRKQFQMQQQQYHSRNVTRLSPNASLTQRSQFYDEALERSLARSRHKRAGGAQQKRPGGAHLRAVKETSQDDGGKDAAALSDEETRAGFVDPTRSAGASDAAVGSGRSKTLIEHVNSLL